MCVAFGNRSRLARHSVAARRGLRGTLRHSRFYCNRKPPLSASGPHRFMKHPAPIFRMKAAAQPPCPATPHSCSPAFHPSPRHFTLSPHRLSILTRSLFTSSRRHPPPFLLRKLTFLDKWGRACFVQNWTKQARPQVSDFWTNQARPQVSKTFWACLNRRSSHPTAEKYVQFLHIAAHFDVQNLHIRIDFSCAKLNI